MSKKRSSSSKLEEEEKTKEKPSKRVKIMTDLEKQIADLDLFMQDVEEPKYVKKLRQNLDESYSELKVFVNEEKKKEKEQQLITQSTKEWRKAVEKIHWRRLKNMNMTCIQTQKRL